MASNQALPFLLGGTLAHLEQTTTGFKVITHVRGRVYRKDRGHFTKPSQSLKARVSLGAVKRRTVCVLSALAADQLESWGINQPCHGPTCTHAHHTRARIRMFIESGELRWVGNGENVAAWTADLTWKGVPSGPERVKVMQLVNGR